jgi:hypothetical protein
MRRAIALLVVSTSLGGVVGCGAGSRSHTLRPTGTLPARTADGLVSIPWRFAGANGTAVTGALRRFRLRQGVRPSGAGWSSHDGHPLCSTAASLETARRSMLVKTRASATCRDAKLSSMHARSTTRDQGAGRMPWAVVSAEVAEMVRPGLADLVEDIIKAVRAEVVEYDQPLEGEFGRLIRGGRGGGPAAVRRCARPRGRCARRRRSRGRARTCRLGER